jgi:hypothetical protein
VLTGNRALTILLAAGILLSLGLSSVALAGVESELAMEEGTPTATPSVQMCLPAVASRDKRAQTPTPPPDGDVTFTGVVLEVDDDQVGYLAWTVEVAEVIRGPQISGAVTVSLVTYPPFGHFDDGLEVDDAVEVFGFHDGDAGTVSLNGSRDYYIVRLAGVTP